MSDLLPHKFAAETGARAGCRMRTCSHMVAAYQIPLRVNIDRRG